MRRILVLGAGFAGLWAAVGAARKRDEIGDDARDLEILVVDRHPYHNIRVRNYEADLSDVTVPLASVFDPIDVRHLAETVETIDYDARAVTVATPEGCDVLTFDRLVFALGSVLPRPPFAGADRLFNVDTYEAGQRLNAHVAGLRTKAELAGRDTVVVVGAGFTGIEVATEMRVKLRDAFGTGRGRVILVDRHDVVGAGLGPNAQPAIVEALVSLDIEVLPGVEIIKLDNDGAYLTDGSFIPTQTVVWCAGMQANPLAELLPGDHDRLGRVQVDAFMQLAKHPHVFVAGDAATFLVDGVNPTLMSCQYARPMGRFAGHNVVADLCGRPMLPLAIDWYVTVLDLGAWGALYTAGRDRQVIAAGLSAKATKETINRQRIYPPGNGSRDEILAAGAPVVQNPPQEVRQLIMP